MSSCGDAFCPDPLPTIEDVINHITSDPFAFAAPSILFFLLVAIALIAMIRNR